MLKLRAPLMTLLLGASCVLAQAAPPEKTPVSGTVNTNAVSDVTVRSKDEFEISPNGDVFTASNEVVVVYSNALLTADTASVNRRTGDIFADGSVRLQRGDQTWVGSHLHYNFLTKQMDGEQFRTGRAPFFAAGEGLHAIAEGTNKVYTATNGLITTDDYFRPLQKIRAREIRIVPDQYFEVHNATLYAGPMPVFFLPYYRRSLAGDQNDFSFLPGYRSSFGPYLLSRYNWSLNDQLDGAVHADWREKRGFGTGPDLFYHLGEFGSGAIKYYYTHDEQPGLDPFSSNAIPSYRQRLYFSYDANLRTNLDVKAQVAYQTDPFIVRDFFESEYRKDTQPNTFVEVNQKWRNWSLDVLTQPRVNPFYDTVERLPEVTLTGFRQQILGTPLYYESESSAGYFRRLFSDTNLTALPFYATRADTFHQITLPETYFGWLNVTPRAGGRFTAYSTANGAGATTTNENRDVFNTGAEVSFKASRVWSAAQSRFWDVDGLRHIIQPSMNYVYVPRPNDVPSQLPQFDYELTNTFGLLPLEFPDYNAIDSIDSQNTIRFGLNNRLQTKRGKELEALVSWSVYTDWRLRPRTNQTTFSDIYSDLALKPRSWLTFDSQTRYDIAQGRFNLAQHSLTFQPNTTWSWTVGHLFLRDGTFPGIGDNLLSSVFFYRLNENWGTRTAHYFDARAGNLQEQDYSIYRDLRSWTVALTFRALNSQSRGHDYAVAFTFSLKSFPRIGLGSDTVNAASLVGY